MSTDGLIGTDWQERIDFKRMREHRLNRAKQIIKEHKLGAVLCFYDENMRYITGTLTPGWNKLKPGLRYVLLCDGGEPIVYEQGDIGFHLMRTAPWLKKENIKYSYAWIKGAAGPASKAKAKQFTEEIKAQLKKHNVLDAPLGVDFIDINLIEAFKEAGINWTDGMTPLMRARAIKSKDEQECLRTVAAICDGCHHQLAKIMKPGMRENEVVAEGMYYLYKFPGVEDVEDVIVSSGPNTWPNWRNFSDRIIKPGDILFIDLAAVTWNGYKSCYYRTYCIGGKPKRKHVETYKRALEWLNNSIDAVKPGVTTRDIASHWPECHIWKDLDGNPYKEEDQAAANLWGHGLGLAQYDLPVVSRIYSMDHPIEIEEGMTFALETQDGEMFDYGVRIEEMIVVTRNGHDLLTRFPIDEITVCD